MISNHTNDFSDSHARMGDDPLNNGERCFVDVPSLTSGLNPNATHKEDGHFVQFYDSDAFLLNSLSGYVASGLGAGDACVVVARKAHRDQLEDQVRSYGFDIDRASQSRQYVSLDSSETLSRFMVDGAPDRTRFREVVGPLISQAYSGFGKVRVFGDMVAELSRNGQHAAAINLESFWNELRESHNFSLYCAYPMSVFRDETLGATLHDVCAEHSWVIPSESYSILPDQDSRLRAIILLQQKAQALEAELKERELLLSREQQARAEAEAANRLKDQFLATVSHELRTPLNAIIGWSHMLGGGKLDQVNARRAVATIERNAKAQAQLIEDLLDVSRMVTDKLNLHMGPVDLASVINHALDGVQLAAQAKDVSLEVLLDPAARHVDGDAGRLQQVVWNLLDNALKFTPRGGKISVRLRSVGDHHRIEVADTGCGINQDFLPFIFDRFRQEDGTSTRIYGGLGLGLAIVKYLVELHKGTVSAESPGEGRGATFVINLTAALRKETELPSAGNVRRAETRIRYCEPQPRLNGVQILLVDDNRDTLQILTAKLTECGGNVEIATSVAEALDSLQWFRPDLLISDLAMPGADGFVLIDKIRKRETGKPMPAIALTAYVCVGDRVRALAAGYNVFVPKPVQPDELVAAIVSLIESDV